ncbi:MAG: hypothetical protein ABJN22_01810 [Litorimonas sp.]
MNGFSKAIGVMCCLGLLGCQPATSITPLEAPDLPVDLPESYRAALYENPEATAQRFVAAFDGLAKTGPVTRRRVQDYTRLQDGLERGRLLGYVLALDLNGDTNITQSEYEVFSSFPKGPNKILALKDLFQSDANQDEIISLPEAVLYSRDLHARAGTQDMRPIESYLMLYDLNSDGEVMRSELTDQLFSLSSKPMR